MNLQIVLLPVVEADVRAAYRVFQRPLKFMHENIVPRLEDAGYHDPDFQIYIFII